MAKHRLLILQDQAHLLRFLGTSLADNYEVLFAADWQKALAMLANTQIAGFFFPLPAEGLASLAALPASVRLFCVVSATQRPPSVPAPLTGMFFLPAPYNLLEIKTVLRQAFKDKEPPAPPAPLDLEPKIISENTSEAVGATPEIPPEPASEVTQNHSVIPPKTAIPLSASGLALSPKQNFTRPATTRPFSLIHNTVLDLVHSVKNPLVSIQTFAQMLPEKINDQEFRENFSRFVNSEINLVNERLNHFLEIVSIPTLPKEEFPAEQYLYAVRDELSRLYPRLPIEIESGTLGHIIGNCQKLTEATVSVWSTILDVVKEPLLFVVHFENPYQSQMEITPKNFLEFYFTLKFKAQYIDMELDFLSTMQKPKGVEILHALRLIEEMDGTLLITKADKDVFAVRISLPSLQEEKPPVMANYQ